MSTNPFDKVFQSHHLNRGIYNPFTQELHVEFVNGSRGVYSNVPIRRWDELCQSNSPGSYLHEQIRPNYSYRRVESGGGSGESPV